MQGYVVGYKRLGVATKLLITTRSLVGVLCYRRKKTRPCHTQPLAFA